MKYFPINEEPFKAKLGLMPLNLSDWLERDETFGAQIALRERLIREHLDEVLVITPGNEEACLELFDLVGAFVRMGERPASALEAMKKIAISVQEDFVILTPGQDVKAAAALVCFPSRWLLASKIGQNSDAIHAPVPGFGAIAKQTKGFLDRIATDKPMWRTNWTIHDSDELFCPRPVPHGPIPVEKVIATTYFRCERQTLRRMSRTNQVVFSIRTYVTPMTEVIADPERRSLLKKILVSMPADVANYKGMGSFVHTLIEAL